MSLAVRSSLLIFLIASALFIPFLGEVHLFDWDEINFAECAREMLVLNEYGRVYIDYLPFWEKPPLFIWMQAASMNMFGVNEFAARFPNALCGVISLLFLYHAGRRIISHRFGIYWVMAYAGSLFPNMYFKSGIIDPFFNLFIFLSLYHFILYVWKYKQYLQPELKRSKAYYAIMAGMFMGLAVMTKGPAALLIFGLCALAYWLFFQKLKIFWSWKHTGLYLLALLVVSLAWYGYETWKHGTWFVQEFITYQIRLLTTHDAGQKGFFGYHYVVLLIGCFPASVLAIGAFRKTESVPHERDFKRWMLLLFWVVTLLFTFVQSRIIHYSSMAWFPLTFLAAWSMHMLYEKRLQWTIWLRILLAVLGILIGLALAVFPFIAMNAKMLEPYLHDEFAKASLLAEVNWRGWEPLVGLLFIACIFKGLHSIKKEKVQEAAWYWFGGTACTIFLASVLIVPKVERFSQGAAIDFLKARAGENCYVQAIGYKSYAHLFYAQRPAPEDQRVYDVEWLLRGDIDKPAYFVSRVDRVKNYEIYPGLKEIYRKNGFVFLKREVPLAP